METLEFLQCYNKMCNSHVSDCVGCEAQGIDCELTTDEPEKLVAAVERWAKAHPEEAADVTQALRQAEAQTGEVAPVVHGHWVYKRRRSGGFRIRTGLLKNWERVKVLIDEREDTMEPFCSVCGAHNDSTNDQNMRYCPHCGSKMDVEIDK